MNDRLPMGMCRRRLALLWFAGSAVALTLFWAQTMGGKYGDETAKAWGWFVPTVLPTLSLIIGVVAAQALHPDNPAATVSSLAYYLSLWLSATYLVLVVATPLMEPIVRPENPLDFFNLATLWLSPIHGLAGIALGVFFVSKETENKDSKKT